jgi:hypothetical protein
VAFLVNHYRFLKSMKIKLSDNVSIDLDKAIESRILVQANSGGGKSYTLRRFIEQTFGKKQIIIIDPEGEFGNMRAKYDFVYVGQGGDAPAEPRSAALLARRLLETKANAIIDIYELGGQRGAFVKNFFEACVNMPKELWTDCFFILDEAHKFAPEKGQGESVALGAVIDMASLGRKRGYALIPATQRPAKLSKDVVAECNNKLIGRASLDLDRERSAKELGFRTKEDILSLRDLAPGEFYAFGPAISNQIVKTFIGDVSVKPPKRGTGRSVKIAPPTAKVKAILAQLADLPHEAEEEAKTIAEFKAKLTLANREIAELKRNPVKENVTKEVTKIVEKPVLTDKQIKALSKIFDRIEKEANRHGNAMALLWGNFNEIGKAVADAMYAIAEFKEPTVPLMHIPVPVSPTTVKSEFIPLKQPTDDSFGKGEMAVLNAIAQIPEGITNEHLAILTGYKTTSRRVYTNNLARAGYIEKRGDTLIATQQGVMALGSSFVRLPEGPELRQHFLSTLPEGERKIFSIINQSGQATRQEIEEQTQYKTTSIRVYTNKLVARKAIVKEGDSYRLHGKLV